MMLRKSLVKRSFYTNKSIPLSQRISIMNYRLEKNVNFLL